MKEYLKMADVFKPGVGLNVQITCLASQADIALVAGYIKHACEYHDDLVAEVERLTKELQSVSNQLVEADSMGIELQGKLDAM